MKRLLTGFVLGLAAGIAIMEAWRWRCEKEPVLHPWQNTSAHLPYPQWGEHFYGMPTYADCGER